MGRRFRAATRKERPHMDPGWFRAGTRKERPCFAAECGLDPFGHTRALEGPFFDPGSEGRSFGLGRRFRAATRTERPCFAAECGLDRRGHTWTPDGLEQAHEENGPVLLQNVAATPLGTHEHSRVHFLIRAPRDGV